MKADGFHGNQSRVLLFLKEPEDPTATETGLKSKGETNSFAFILFAFHILDSEMEKAENST